ncbi:MAG: hypothetical protein M9958_05720 [Chitinophagales bacterium]|nr:hypothetical protein [Chitinophagales bacterium]
MFRRPLAIIIGVGLILLSFLHYSNALTNDFSLDDYLYLAQVKNIHRWSDLQSIFQIPFGISDYRPITTLSFGIEKLLSGGNIYPHIAHWVNLILYILCSLSLYRFVKKIATHQYLPHIAIITTIIFITIPLHNSMISNIKSRDGLLSFMFGMIYLNLIIEALTYKRNNLGKIILSILAIGFVILSIFSKVDGFNFIFITPLLYIIYFKKFSLKYIIRTIIIFILLTKISISIYSNWTTQKDTAVEKYNKVVQNDPVLFTENPIVNYTSWDDKIAYSILTYYEYTKMLLRPNHHYYYYGYDMVPVLKINDPKVIAAGIFLLLLIVSIFLFYKKNKVYSFGVAFYLVGLLYCSNLIIPVSGIVADRYAFIASAGACTAIAVLIQMVMVKLITLKKQAIPITYRNKTITQIPTSTIYLIPIFLLSSLFYLPENRERSKEWASLQSIFEADLPEITHQSYEGNLIAIKSFMAMAQNNDSIESKKYYNKVLYYGSNAKRIYPDGQYAQDLMITAYYELGQMYEAMELARKVVEKFDSTEIGWRVLNEYYYIQEYRDSLENSCKKVLSFAPLDPVVNMMYVSNLKYLHQTNVAQQYLDELERKYPESSIPEDTRKYLNSKPE